MMAQFLLTVALGIVYLYAMAQRQNARIFRLVMTLICASGLVVVWAPQLSTRVANFLNIGRGADLITYIWILLSLLIAINVHIRLRLESERITQLARELAFLRANKAPDPSHANEE